MIESLSNVESRIAEIQSRISSLTGQPAASAAVSAPGSFSSVLAAKSGETPAPSAWDDMIQQAATEYGLDPALLKAVMLSESGGNPSAQSSAGAMGLMQLMPSTARSLGVTNPYDPKENLFGGARYLRGLLDRLGKPELAVAAYNAGAGAVRKYGGVPPYPETQNYVATVMAKWQGGSR